MRSLFFGGIALVFYVIACAVEVRRLEPPHGVDTLAEFVSSMPPARHLGLAKYKGSDHLVWIGGCGVVSIPSGPSCHVFDRRGNLAISHWQTGEGGEIDKIYLESWGRPLTLPEARAWIRP